MTVPSIANAREAHERLHVWSKLYDLGKVQIPILTALSSVALGTVAYSAASATAGVHHGTLLWSAVGSALSIIPFTFAVMMPGIHRLKAIEVKSTPRIKGQNFCI
ncbi:hypothetical protein AURDEDRAFT_171967 [Auricularia subglabra TFB-10046 SS5]|nr:hypothetical protein AURDEDRAFT_171967 [Auricularia subglabra TFB-10046 SS5]